MTANPQRGDVKITLCGNDHVLALTHEAIIGIESRLDTGVVGVLRRFHGGNAGHRDAVAIIAEGIRASREKPPKNLGEMIMKTGMIHLAGPLTKYLTNAVTGGEETEPGDDDQGEAIAKA